MMGGAVVVVEDAGSGLISTRDTVKINQKDMKFSPAIVAVIEGSVIEFPNLEEAIYHNIFLELPAQGNMVDLGTYRAGETRYFLAEGEGVIEVFCVIHQRMYAVVVITDNPYFSNVSEDGRYEIKGVPPGNYTLSLWSVDMENQCYLKESRNVNLPDNSTVIVNF
ncbi:MAG: hypothetical protein ACE5OP_12600 [Candidatus Glassbacteria bacterium]